MSDKTIAQKMQIKPGQRVLLLNAPEGFAARLGELPAGVMLESALNEPADVIQCFVASQHELEETLPRLKAALRPGGYLWIIYPKLTSRLAADISRDSIWAYAVTLGLRPVAMIAIDDDWSGFRLKVGG